MKGNYTYLSFIILLLAGFSISSYLLWHHFELSFLETSDANLCFTLFGSSCDGALRSLLSEKWGIPLGGWGIIYYVVLGTLLLLARILGKAFARHAALIIWIWVLIGAAISLFLLATILFNPNLFCPFCLSIHLINVVLIFPVWKLYPPSLLGYRTVLVQAGSYFFLGKAKEIMRARWHTLAFLLVLFVGLAFYQRISMQQLTYQLAADKAFRPELKLKDFLQMEVQLLHPAEERLIAGPPDALVQLVVFSDFQCPACREFGTVAADLFQRFGDGMSFSFKHFPLSNICNPAVSTEAHDQACAAARAAEAAAQQGQFWRYHDTLFNLDWSRTAEDVFLTLARRLELNEVQFQQDFNAEAIQERIAADVSEGLQLDLGGTPAVFLNGRRVYDLSARNLNLLVSFFYFQEKMK